MADTTSLESYPQVKDLTGQKFGRLTVLGFSHHNRVPYWRCRCECGNEKIAHGCRLLKGSLKSCGCFRSESARDRVLTHGDTNTPEFRIWGGIKTRTTNQNDHGYARYGGRGIVMCEAWLNSYEQFLADMGRRPSPKHSIDRIDNDGPYSKENCRWATIKMQCRNRCSNHRVEYRGELLTLAELTERAGFRKMTLRNRIVSGMTVEQAMAMPEKEKALRGPRRRAVTIEC